MIYCGSSRSWWHRWHDRWRGQLQLVATSGVVRALKRCPSNVLAESGAHAVAVAVCLHGYCDSLSKLEKNTDAGVNAIMDLLLKVLQ